MSLSTKLTVCLVGSLLVIFALLGYQTVALQRQHLEEMTFRSADAMSDIIRRSTRHSMLLNHRAEVSQIIKTIGGEPGIERIRLFDEEGQISVSSVDSEIGSRVKKDAEPCQRCHTEKEPLSALDHPKRLRTYTLATGERVLGLIRPIENEPSCYSAPCHAHRSEQKILGVLDVVMSLRDVDNTTAEGTRTQILNLFVAGLIICGIAGALIWVLVHKPVRQLYVGTRQVAAGDLEYKIKVSSRDEIGKLAASFNGMTDELKKANDALKDWARTLETRVEEKTRELKNAHEHIIQVERMASMGKLAAIVAHEINNPMTGILTSARFLLKKIARENLTDGGKREACEHLELIADESGRCGEIVKNLLQFTRQTKGDYHTCDAKQLIAECLRLVQHKTELMDLKVKTDLVAEVPDIVCDPQEIRQALVAVLINGCEAMSHKGRTLEVGARHRAAEGQVEIWVKDEGIGMDEETQQRVFEPFFTTKEQEEVKNVGLGLAVVSGIVHRHSGNIELKSAPGTGTTVSILLPVATENRAPADTSRIRLPDDHHGYERNSNTDRG